MKSQPAQSRKGLLLAVCGAALFALLFLLDWSQFRENLLQNAKLDQLTRQYSRMSSKLDQTQAHRLPKCLIIGARKCGTRALLEALNLHPSVRTARYEVHFFDQNDSYSRGYEWYKAQFPASRPWQIPIEKTPGYFTSSLAPERILAMNASIKLLLIVRDPVIRTISDYTQVHYTKLSKGKSHESFESLVFDGQRLRDDYKPVRNSLYAKHFRRWLRYFPAENIHLVDGDHFIADPLEELRQVEDFLGLEPQIDQRQLYFNETKGFYCFKPSLEALPHCLGDTKGRPHVEVSNATKDRLRTLLRPFNERFFELAGREFDW